MQILKRHSFPALSNLAPRGPSMFLAVCECSDSPRKLTVNDANSMGLSIVPLSLDSPFLPELTDISTLLELETAIILDFGVLR
jgi:hypothetical protein